MKEGYNQLNVSEIFVKEGDEIVVIGQPEEDDENHNCDYMGCSSVEHVIYRAKVSNEIK